MMEEVVDSETGKVVGWCVALDEDKGGCINFEVGKYAMMFVEVVGSCVTFEIAGSWVTFKVVGSWVTFEVAGS